MLAEAGLWLAKTIGADQLKRLLGRRGLQAENRSLKKGARRQPATARGARGHRRPPLCLDKERDQLQAEVIRLRVENAALRAAAENTKGR